MSASLPPHRLEIDVDVDGPSLGVVLHLRGELDAATVGQLERSLTELPTPLGKLVLDLHELSFVDSLGLNMLFRGREWARSHGVVVRVTRAPVHVQRLIALAALDGTFGPFYTDVAAALRA
jgi:stage II sporulation protein AA (anti-sigma F factor antagonist)